MLLEVKVKNTRFSITQSLQKFNTGMKTDAAKHPHDLATTALLMMCLLLRMRHLLTPTPATVGFLCPRWQKGTENPVVHRQQNPITPYLCLHADNHTMQPVLYRLMIYHPSGSECASPRTTTNSIGELYHVQELSGAFNIFLQQEEKKCKFSCKARNLAGKVNTNSE